MGMLMHRHFTESANKATQKPVEKPSAPVAEETPTAEKEPVKTASKPVRRGGRGRAK